MILVTGATGMVGGHLLWYLLQKYDRVVAIRRSTSNLQYLKDIFSFYTNDARIFLDKIDWRTADILDLDSLMSATIDVDEIYHCAAVVSLGGNQQDIIDINVEGTRNMVEVALRMHVKKFCFVSSIASCGSVDNGYSVNETTPMTNQLERSMYAQSKFLSEQVVVEALSRGLKAVIVNPGVILGYSGVSTGSSQLFYQVKKGLPFYTPGGTGYVDVQDVVKIMLMLMEKEIYGNRYILVAENNSNKEILEMMADGFNKRRPFIYINKQLLMIVGFVSEVFSKISGRKSLIDRGTAKSAAKRTLYDNSKICTTLNYKFKPVQQTIFEICHYMNPKQ